MNLPVSPEPAGNAPSPATQAAALQQAIMACTAQGWRLQSTGVGTAVMVNAQQGPTTNHVLHAILSLLTCGLWLIVWLCIVLFSQTNPQRSLLVLVDEAGNVTYQHGT
jgi:hypothetical protein